MLPDAAGELRCLPRRERLAMQRALAKLEALGEELGYPHSSAVQGAPEPLRELRPRRGSSTARAFYRRVGGRIVVAAFGPEAQYDARGFSRAVASAVDRLAGLEE